MSVEYKYIAANSTGSLIKGKISAETEQNAKAHLTAQNLLPLEIKPAGESIGISLKKLIGSRVPLDDLIIFSNKFLTLYKAGIPFTRAITTIISGEEHTRLAKTLIEIRSGLESGLGLSEQMAKYPDVFPEMYVNSVAAGEVSGKLDIVLERLIVLMDKQLKTKGAIKKAVRYPIIVVTALVGAFIVIITFVLPKFTVFFEGSGVELPLPTRILLGLNHIITNYYMIGIPAIVLLFFLVLLFFRTETGKNFADYGRFHLPIFGTLFLKIYLARFASMLSVTLSAGVPLLNALEIVGKSIGNRKFNKALLALQSDVGSGGNVTDTMRSTEVFPELVVQMFSVGMESGAMEPILNEIANHYDNEVDYMSEKLTSLLEPMLTVGLGVMVLIMALAIFMPMWNIIKVVNH